MSHGDQLSEMPENFHIIGKTKTAPYAAIAHNSKPFYGIQFHPEVTHSPRGKEVIGRFVLNICKCRANWTMVRATRGVEKQSSNVFCRRNSLERKSPVSARFVDPKGALLAPSAVVWIARLRQN